MSDELSPRLALPFLVAGQAQKEVMHNEALQMIDALVQPVAQSANLSGPPVSPAMGACWIVPGDATGAWSGHEGSVAQWTAGGWRFCLPAAGWRIHLADRGAAMVHDGSGWRDDIVRTDGIYIDGDKIIGARSTSIAEPVAGTVIDSEARLVINEILTMLQGHGLIAS